MIPNHLKEKLMKNQVIPFIGAGASSNIKDSQGEYIFPDWIGLLEKISTLAKLNGVKSWKSLEASIGVIPTPLVLQLVSIIKDELPNTVWRTFLRDIFSIKNVDKLDKNSIQANRLISGIQCPLFITTNYDNVINLTSDVPLKKWTYAHNTEIIDVLNGDYDERGVLHIHGNVDETDSIILTSDDYESLYSKDNTEAEFKRLINSLKRISESYCFLFIGYSLDDKLLVDLLNNNNIDQAGAKQQYYIICKESEAQNKKDMMMNLTPISVNEYDNEYLDLLSALGEIKSNSDVKDKPVVVSQIINNLPEPEYNDTSYIGEGRIKQCHDIKDHLLTSRDYIFTINGEGGIGKSAMARYISELIIKDDEDVFNYIIWFSAKTEQLTFNGIENIENPITTFVDLIKNVADFIGVDYSTDNDISLNLITHLKNKKCLLIFDNLETISDPALDLFMKDLPEGNKILVTSRRTLSRGNDYTPELLSEKDTLDLALVYYRYLEKKQDIEFKHEDIKKYITELHLNPLAIKWFITGLKGGMEPAKLYELHETKVLEYCIKNIYSSLSESGIKIIDILRSSGEVYSYSTLSFLIQKPYDSVEDVIIDELYTRSLVDREIHGTKYRIKIKPRVQSYLKAASPLTENALRSQDRQGNKLIGRHDNLRADIKNVPYKYETITNVEESNLVASIILSDLLKSFSRHKKNERYFHENEQHIFTKINEAKKNSPDFFEIFRVEAEALNCLNKGLNAKQSYIEGFNKGGSEHPEYLFHFSKFLMNNSGVQGQVDCLSNLQAALKLDPDSHDVWLELCRAIMFKGDHADSRNEIFNILNSQTNLPKSVIIRACALLLESYKRQLRLSTPDNFLVLIEEQLSAYYLLPRTIRETRHNITKNFDTAKEKINEFENKLSDRFDLNRLQVVKDSIDSLLRVNSQSNIYKIIGFKNASRVTAESIKNSSIKVELSSEQWDGLFPLELIVIGELIIQGGNKKYKRFNRLEGIDNLFNEVVPAVITHKNMDREILIALQENGIMVEVEPKYGKGKFERELFIGEPILIFNSKRSKAVEIKAQDLSSLVSIIETTSNSIGNVKAESKVPQSLVGVIKSIRADKGFAFVTSSNEDFFLHLSKSKRLDFDNLEVGNQVKFIPVYNNKASEKPSAIDALKLETNVPRELKVKKTSAKKKVLKAIRKHGKVSNINDSIIFIESSSGSFIALKADVKEWGEIKKGQEVWFSIKNQIDQKNNKATSINIIR